MLCNSDLRHGLEFDCNQQTSFDWGGRTLIDFNAFRIDVTFIDMNEKKWIEREARVPRAPLDLPLQRKFLHTLCSWGDLNWIIDKVYDAITESD